MRACQTHNVNLKISHGALDVLHVLHYRRTRKEWHTGVRTVQWINKSWSCRQITSQMEVKTKDQHLLIYLKDGARLTAKTIDFDTKWDKWPCVVPIVTRYVGLKNATYDHRKRPNFTAYCSCGKVSLPPLAQLPSPLRDLLEGQTLEAKQFRNHIRKYNNSFAFTFFGAKIDQSMARGGVYTYRLQGKLHHRMGSLLPSEGETPKLAQMYIHDQEMQEECRLNFREELHPDILHQLQTMLHDINPYAQL